MKAVWIVLLGFLAQGLHAQTYSFGTESEAYSLQVIESDLHHTVLEFSLHHFEATPTLINQAPYQFLSLDAAGILTEKGLPQLPKVYRNIEIGDAATVHVAIQEEEHETFELGDIAPSKGSLFRDVDPETVAYTFDSFYQGIGKRASFPDAVVSTSTPFTFRKTHGVTVQIHPFSFSPQSHATVVYKRLLIEITTDDIRAENMMDTADNESFNFLYQNLFLNHQKIAGAQMRNNDATSRELGDLLIITHPNFLTALTPFVDWKMQMGFSTQVVTLSQTGKTAQAIKTYIRSAYLKNPNLAYVLLVGAASYVPYYPGTAGNARGNEADPLYGVLTPNGYPELIVARFSAKTRAEVTNMINRSISYEQTPTEGDWYERAIGIASAEGSPTTDGQRADYERTALLGASYREVAQLYDPNVTASDIAGAVNNGASMINYIGHGSETSWVTGDFSNNDVNALSNVGMLPLVISVACVNGHFASPDGDVFAERWLKAGPPTEPVGALAMFASSTNQAWIPPTVGQLAIAKLVANGSVTHIGALMLDGSLAVLEDGSSDAQQTFQTWHIFGDPTIMLRTQTPTPVSVMPSLSASLQAGVKMNVQEAGLRVSLTSDHQLLGSVMSGADGDASFPSLNLSHGKKVTVTVTGQNRIPLIETIQVP